jgi:hypothetical protein
LDGGLLPPGSVLALPQKEGSMANEKKQQKKLTLKLSLKKETLRELNESQLDTLDQVVGGTAICTCTYIEARTAM